MMEREDIERGGGGGGGEVSVWDQKWKRERERWRRERRHEEETTRGRTVFVHSLYCIAVIFETIHDPMAPYLPSPWPLGTSLPAFVQGLPSPDFQGPLASDPHNVLPPKPKRLCPHAPTHPNTPPPPAVPSPCSSALVLGVNAASTASVPHTAACGRTRKRARSAKTWFFLPRARATR